MPKRRVYGGAAAAAAADGSPYSKAIKLVNVKSKLLPPDEALGMFDVPPTQNPDVLAVRYVSYHPQTALDDKNDIIEILVTGSFNEYVRPKDIKMRVKARLVLAAGGGTAMATTDTGSSSSGENEDAAENETTNTNGTTPAESAAGKKPTNANEANLAPHKKVSLSWLGMYALFSDQQVYVNGQLIDSSNNLFQHQAAVKLRTHTALKQLLSEYRYAGVNVTYPHRMDNYLLDEKVWDNCYEKSLDIIGSQEFTYVGKVLTPLCDSNNYLPTNTDLRIKWKKADAKHYLMAKDATEGVKYELKITGMELIVPKLRLRDPLAITLETKLRSEPAKFYLRNWMTTFISMAQQQKQIIQEGWMSGDAPLYVIATLCHPDRFNGSYNKATTKYDDFGLLQMKICLEDEHEHRRPIRITPQDNSEAVMSILQSLGYLDPNNPKECLIGKYNWGKGLQTFFFNETNDSVIHEGVYQEMKSGNQRIELELAATKDHTIMIVLHCIFQSELSIYADRQVTFHNKTIL